ncbi:glycosyltransferase family 39 protein [bacterium]|nr:glycosyltransferase family 39 protein [bacterium]
MNISPRLLVSIFVFVLVAIASGLTVAGPGLTWDEPAYRGSEVRLQEWVNELIHATSLADRLSLLNQDSIDYYFEFNRFGPNFHPPLSSYGHLLTWAGFSHAIDDLSARRLASAIELAITCAVLSAFMARHFCKTVGLLAGLCLATMPRVFGDSHIAGTDVPLLCLWTLTALSFPSALNHRRGQYVLAVLLGMLCLVKFTGLFIVIPLGISFLAYACTGNRRQHLVRWIGGTVLITLPLLPIAWALLVPLHPEPGQTNRLVEWVVDHSRIWSIALFWPAVVLFAWSRRRKAFIWPIGLELPWRTLAYAPLIAIALNPTWWHDPVGGLISFFDLSIRRQGYLPDIEIFYLGKQYLFSLPWHNAWVLMGVTIPIGMLILTLAGIARSLISREPIALYLLLQAITLPVARMFPVPAHDGVRLFLPAFAFISAMAALGGSSLSKVLIERGVNHRLVWLAIFMVGPIWGAAEIVRWHPYELSYYNIGLPQARDLGFEITYWYDAVTRPVLDDLNEKLPRGASLALPSPRINTEVFFVHQSMGKLRSDLHLDLAQAEGFPFMLLLTHASKSDPFSRLLFGVQPWYASSKEGVRLFSVIDPPGVALAWSLYFLAVDRETHKFAPPDSIALRQALDLLLLHGKDALAQTEKATPAVRKILQAWHPQGMIDPDLAKLLPGHVDALREAIELIATRPEDLRLLIETPGYPAEERFRGPLESKK